MACWAAALDALFAVATGRAFSKEDNGLPTRGRAFCIGRVELEASHFSYFKQSMVFGFGRTVVVTTGIQTWTDEKGTRYRPCSCELKLPRTSGSCFEPFGECAWPSSTGQVRIRRQKAQLRAQIRPRVRPPIACAFFYPLFCYFR